MRIFGLEKNIFILGLTSFFNDFSNEMIHSAFPAFFTSVLKTGAASLGLVEGIADGVANFLKIYSGHLSDRIQRRRSFIFSGYGLSVIIRPLYMFFGTVGGVLGLRVIDRIGKGVREAPRDVIISASAPAGEIGRSFGYQRAMDAAGGIFGPLAAYLILYYLPFGFNVIFVSAFLLGIVAVATIFFVKDVVGAKSESGSRIFSFSAIGSMPAQFRIYLLAIFLLSIGTLPTAVLLLKTTSIGLMLASIPLYYLVYSVSYTAVSYFAGKKSDTSGTAVVLGFGYITLIVSYIFINFAYSPLTLGIGFAILGVFAASTDAAQRAYTGRIVPFATRGTGYGLFTAAIGFGSMAAGIGGGYLWQVHGPGMALVAAAGFVLLGTIVLMISLKAKRA